MVLILNIINFILIISLFISLNKRTKKFNDIKSRISELSKLMFILKNYDTKTVTIINLMETIKIIINNLVKEYDKS